ncbi:tRNA-dependent cyclodipeptide synthase [Vibrio mangrovi]|uniref:Cyclodipeptide synthase n=1 Tax=Vibrio mangrovi TaxID=474394 RepID=A0A1Y6IU21_9VIBR|nr:tRNA-dependent cyclodipeptide synthase [Vibrio mangrovi]MDW6004853.1 tRNA-dependent cyclodipeptide synthase [Vibrio mangrovi]SMS01144.1 hypothetical protein VIM7927_02421 [Vibrio mangrovi]
MSHIKKYKGEIQRVSPKSKKEYLKEKPKCFIGISLNNPNFLDSKFTGLIDFVANRHNECTFLLGDYIHRLTLQIRDGLSEEDALKIALAMGDKYIQQNEYILNEYINNLHVNFIRGSEIHDNEKFKIYFQKIKSEYDSDVEFRTAVNKFSRIFISRSSDEEAISDMDVFLSSLYVLEELAETCYMISLGHNVLLYPGSLAIFENIADGLFPNLPDEFKQLVNVSIRLKSRKQLELTIS